MTHFRMTVLALAGALIAPAALAAEPTDAPVATAGPSVGEQIDAYLRSSPAATLPDDPTPGVTPGQAPRGAHGVVELGIGNHGYRRAYVRSDMPLGETGVLSIAVGETRGPAGYGGYSGAYGGPYGYGRGTRRTVGIGLDFSAEARDAQACAPGSWPGSWKDEGPRRLDPASTDEARRLPCGPGRGPASPDGFAR